MGAEGVEGVQDGRPQGATHHTAPDFLSQLSKRQSFRLISCQPAWEAAVAVFMIIWLTRSTGWLTGN